MFFLAATVLIAHTRDEAINNSRAVIEIALPDFRALAKKRAH
jgi:hypothetical protein